MAWIDTLWRLTSTAKTGGGLVSPVEVSQLTAEPGRRTRRCAFRGRTTNETPGAGDRWSIKRVLWQADSSRSVCFL
jgi:hypothetical protein